MWMNPPPITRVEGFRVSRRDNGCIRAVAPKFGVTATGRRLPAQFGQPELRKQAMSMTRNFCLGLLGAFLAVMVAITPAATQTVAQQDAGRDAAIRKCIAEAHRQYPGEGGGSQDMQRADVYKACMVAAGFQP
jgi:hypothetical protein